MVLNVFEKFEIVQKYKLDKCSANEICEERGISRRAFFYWLERFDGSVESLQNQSRAPKNPRRKISPEDEEEIVKLRREKKWGYKRIRFFFKRRKSKLLSHTAIRNILKKHKLDGYRKRRRKCRGRKPRSKKYSHELLRQDSKYFWIKGFGRINIIAAIDDFSRKLYADAYKTRKAENAIDFVKQIIKEDGAPKEIKTDNAMEFVHMHVCKRKPGRGKPRTIRRKNVFGKFLASVGIRHSFIPAGKPNRNSKVERVILTIQEEFLKLEHFKNLEDLRGKLKEYVRAYNTIREHSSLDGNYPGEVWKANNYIEAVQNVT